MNIYEIKNFNIKNLQSCEMNGIMSIANFAGTNLWKIRMRKRIVPNKDTVVLMVNIGFAKIALEILRKD